MVNAKTNTTGEAFIITKHDDYTVVIAAKKTYSSAVNAVINHVRCTLPTFGTKALCEKQHSQLVKWFDSLKPDEISLLGLARGQEYADLINMWALVQDIYKIDIIHVNID